MCMTASECQTKVGLGMPDYRLLLAKHMVMVGCDNSLLRNLHVRVRVNGLTCKTNCGMFLCAT